MRRAALALLLLTAPALADPAADKRDAQVLFKEANRLLQGGDFAGALELYRSAYEKFPSPRILLNMGAALRQLGRQAEAADAYFSYLSDPAVDAKHRAEVQKILRELDARVGRVRIEVSEPDARVTIDDRPVTGERVRVDPGEHRVRAAKAGFDAATAVVTVVAGGEEAVALTLSPTPPAPVAPPPAVDLPEPAPVVRATAADRRGGPWGAFVRVALDPVAGGGAGIVGASLRLAGPLELAAAAVIGPSPGGELLLTYRPGSGRVRAQLDLGIPILSVDGSVAPAGHAGAGLVLLLTRRLALHASVAIEHFPTLDEERHVRTVFLPALALQGWLAPI